jgi:hypothetical protein
LESHPKPSCTSLLPADNSLVCNRYFPCWFLIYPLVWTATVHSLLYQLIGQHSDVKTNIVVRKKLWIWCIRHIFWILISKVFGMYFTFITSLEYVA